MVSTDNTDDDTSVKDRLMQLQEVIDDITTQFHININELCGTVRVINEGASSVRSESDTDLCKIKAAKLVEKYRIAEKLIRNLPSIDVSKEDQLKEFSALTQRATGASKELDATVEALGDIIRLLGSYISLE